MGFTYLFLPVLDEYWQKPSGPIFFYTGNEGPITSFWEASGFVHELASKYHALIVFGEHVSYMLSMFLNLVTAEAAIPKICDSLQISKQTSDLAAYKFIFVALLVFIFRP